MENSIVLGVDIGGSHITAALVNLETKSLIESTRVRAGINSKGASRDIICNWVGVIETTMAKMNGAEKKIGIAMPGPFDYEAGISLMQNQDKYDDLYGLNIKEILSNKLGISAENIQFMNDAECFLKGEVFGGAAKGVKRAVGLTLGTGLGSSRYRNGVVEDANLWCAPFLDAIAEEYLSTRWFTKRYQQLTGNTVTDVKELIGSHVSREVKDRIFQEFGKNLALILNTTMAEDKPEAIILGGNISKAYGLFTESLNRNLSPAFSDTTIHRTALGEEACLVGAASAWHRHRETAPVSVQSDASSF